MAESASAKGRKIGRNTKKCARYEAEGRRERHKKIRMLQDDKRRVKAAMKRNHHLSTLRRKAQDELAEIMTTIQKLARP